MADLDVQNSSLENMFDNINSLAVLCKYCRQTCCQREDPYLTCEQCSNDIHLRCLRSGGVPGNLPGDVFFKLLCEDCSGFENERITRPKLHWVVLLTIALYGLSKRYSVSTVSNKKGFYHYRYHIAKFIDMNYDNLIQGDDGLPSKPTKNWMGTISGTLSHFSPKFFLAGSKFGIEAGWWKLAQEDVPPVIILEDYFNHKKERPVFRYKLDYRSSQTKPTESIRSESASDDSSMDDESRESQDLDTFDNNSGHHSDLPSESDMFSRAYVEPSATLSGVLFADELDQSSDSMDIDIADIEDLEVKHDEPQKTVPGTIKLETEDEVPSECLDEQLVSVVSEDSEGSEGEGSSYVAPAPPPASLFNIRLKTAKQRCPANSKPTAGNANLVPMSEFEESRLWESLRRASATLELPGAARRLYRKLSVRRLQRSHGRPVFDLDAAGLLSTGRSVQDPGDVRVLDRFQRVTARPWTQEKLKSSFSKMLTGEVDPNNFYSAYTHRYLPAYIWQDSDTSAVPWLNVMDELLARVHRAEPDWTPPERACIDYCYVRPQHIGSVNRLCNQFFYPGIDLSETLAYPDFSCVALYKRLVIGFAFLVPDTGHNEAYISFLFTRPEWRRAGIANFMLYHLTQTCMGKDIALHCSVTNPAVLLYQKYGFKIEQYIQDFYDKYLPINSQECKHAFFLRLSR